ncbi:hypothetical protein RI054_42g149670 [Pseudoscourfieldia marina]
MVKVEMEQVMKQAAVEVEAVAVWQERHPPPKQAGLPREVAPETEVVEWGSSDGVEAAETEVQPQVLGVDGFGRGTRGGVEASFSNA